MPNEPEDHEWLGEEAKKEGAPCFVCNGAGVIASCPDCKLAFAVVEGQDLCPFCNVQPANLSVCGVCHGTATV